MTKKTIYLCGPINGRGDDTARTWREQAKELGVGSFYFLDPLRNDYRAVPYFDKQISAQIVNMDKLDIRNSDGLLVYFDAPSVGTSMEVFYAHSLGKPVVLLDRYGGAISPWLVHHCNRVTTHLPEALVFLDSLMNQIPPHPESLT